MNEKIIKRHFCETDLQKLKIKKEKLAILRELEKAILLNEKEIEFLLHKENELLGNKANVIGQ